jgi:hypothetical protein
LTSPTAQFPCSCHKPCKCPIPPLLEILSTMVQFQGFPSLQSVALPRPHRTCPIKATFPMQFIRAAALPGTVLPQQAHGCPSAVALQRSGSSHARKPQQAYRRRMRGLQRSQAQQIAGAVGTSPHHAQCFRRTGRIIMFVAGRTEQSSDTPVVGGHHADVGDRLDLQPAHWQTHHLAVPLSGCRKRSRCPVSACLLAQDYARLV